MGNTVDLIYKLTGDIEEGIDVFELSPILLSFGKLINEAHRTIYPNNPEIAVKVRPFQKGSFEINIIMFAKSSVQQLISFLKSDSGKDILVVLGFLGLSSTVSGINLLKLIYLLKGKLQSVKPLESGEFNYYSDDNSFINVPKEVHALYQNCQIQQTIYNSVARPLELEGVKSVESFVKNKEETTKVSYDMEMVKPIKDYSQSQIPTEEKVKTTETIRKVWIQPKRVSLEGEKNSWSFRIGDYVFTANLSDQDFLEKIKEGTIRLAQKDRFYVELLERQQFKVSGIITTHEVIKVIEYIRAEEIEQGKLDF